MTTQTTYTEKAAYDEMHEGYYIDSRFPSVIQQYNPASHAQYLLGDGVVKLTRSENPDWRSQVAKSQDASTYYYRDGWSWKAPLSRCKVRGVHLGGAWTTSAYGKNQFLGSIPSNLQDIEDTAVRDIALAALKRRLNEQQGNASLLAPTAELKELRQLIGLATNVTGKFLEVCRLSLLKRGMRLSKAVSGAYLAWVFGLRPLIGDINGALDAIESYLTRYDRSVRLKGAFWRDWVSSVKDRGTTGTYGATVSLDTEIQYKLSYRYVGSFDLLVNSANDYGIAEHLGFTKSDVVPALWELLPFSWVFDYFTTMGSFLEDVFSSSPGTLKYLVLDKKLEVVGRVRQYYTKWSDGGGSVWDMTENVPSDGWWKYFQFVRTPQSSIPHRALRFHTLDAVGSRAVDKLLNLTAVLIQLQRR